MRRRFSLGGNRCSLQEAIYGGQPLQEAKISGLDYNLWYMVYLFALFAENYKGGKYLLLYEQRFPSHQSDILTQLDASSVNSRLDGMPVNHLLENYR